MHAACRRVYSYSTHRSYTIFYYINILFIFTSSTSQRGAAKIMNFTRITNVETGVIILQKLPPSVLQSLSTCINAGRLRVPIEGARATWAPKGQCNILGKKIVHGWHWIRILDVVTHIARRDHQKSTFGLRHAINLIELYCMTKSKLWFSMIPPSTSCLSFQSSI